MSTYHDAESLARLLGEAKRSGQGWECLCPAHDDAKPSLWVVDGDLGAKPRFHCRARCQWEAVLAAIASRGLTWRSSGANPNKEDRYAKTDRKKESRRRSELKDVISPVPDSAPKPATVQLNGQSPTRIYEYRDQDGKLLRFVGRLDRIDGKVIRPYIYMKRADGSACWAMGTPDELHTLYGLECLAARPEDPVLVVEGEKTADAARKLLPSHVVVTWQGGANAVNKSDWRSLSSRDVTLWPDADDAGRIAAVMITEALLTLGVSARTVRTIDLPEKWDLADQVPGGVKIAALLEGAGTVPKPEPAQGERPLVDFIITADALVKMDIPQREYLVTPFISTNSLNMIYAERGLGKTWFSLSLALCLARGDDFLDYLVERPCPVLYIDGEMPLADLQARVTALDPDPPATMMILPSEILFREAKPLNLHNKDDQSAIEGAIAALVERAVGPSVVILDNLSSLSGGVDENDNSALDALLQWLLGLRHQGLAIILVHHAGKSGTQRGASRREDLLDTSIALVRPDEEDEPHPGAHFILTFPKTRGMPPDPREMELMLRENQGQLQWHFSEKRKIDPTIELLRLIWELKPATQADIAKYKGVTAGRISQLCSKLRRKKFLKPTPSLELEDEGKEALIIVYPELEAKMLIQDELGFRDVM